jgi:hypothetical protein
LFLIVGLFVLSSGRRSLAGQHIHYHSTVACLDALPIPADIRIDSSLSEPVLQDNTAVFVIGKVFVPSSGDHGPILIDSLQVAPIPGDPNDHATYRRHIPSFPFPVVIAQGSVASANATDSSATLSFALAVSDYVHSSVKRSTVLSVLP